MTEVSDSTAIAPELLAPAGNWDCARAAIANGADAIYFGLDCGFNARARAANFSLSELGDLMRLLHLHGVRGYVTLNTLAFSDELEAIEETVRRIADAAVDAVLVQDLGVAQLVHRIAPELEMHASTQMTLSSAEGINVAAELGIQRVVVARELSVREIRQIAAKSAILLEVFVHGALCVAYSGQCLTSESLGGRSANRGQCAQACRLPYEVICDGEDVDLGEQRYLLSPQDLAAYELIPELIAAGVRSFKIEGRLKTPEYVANITRRYRQAIDSAMAGEPVEFTPREVEEMELSFSRGFSRGWLEGCDHKMLVPALSSAKRGVQIGQVERVGKRCVVVMLQGRLKSGDGVVFAGDRAAGEEQGGRVFAIYRGGNRISTEVDRGKVELAFARGSIDTSTLYQGQTIWKTDDPALTRKLRKSFSGELHGKDRPVTINAQARVGKPLRISAQCPGLPALSLSTDEPLAAATKHPATQELLAKQLGRLGETGFRLTELTADIVGGPMVPLSVLGKLRRELTAALATARDGGLQPSCAVAREPVLPQLRVESAPQPSQPTEPALHVLCRTLAQMPAVLDSESPLVYVDFQDIREYRQAVPLARAAGAAIFLATPRIQKPDEAGISRALARHGADGLLVRNLAGLRFCRDHQIDCIADYSLNVTNELTAALLLRQGAQRVTASYDLNRDQLLELASRADAARLEVVVHQHMPMFHMEHCVFCAVLSEHHRTLAQLGPVATAMFGHRGDAVRKLLRSEAFATILARSASE
jgi:putative protease